MRRACPRCRTPFICTPHDIDNCPCQGVDISASTREFLGDTYYDCLCNQCLLELDPLVVKARKEPFDPKKKLSEGLHYHMEGPLMVFTQYYHIWKGECCQNSCRNCPYGYYEEEII
ncbi:MAG: cysteine-rich CWC family protein [Saprospiraceae bacterium]|nr:cysteine-rich CWC family protein [Saprospiraceae bacterium]